MWYEEKAQNQAWSVRTLQRNIETQYYHRLLSFQNKNSVENEMKNLTKNLLMKLQESIKKKKKEENYSLSE